MRVTNKMLSNNFLRDMRTNLNNMNTLQGQMTSGKQIRKPSDDPFKAFDWLLSYLHPLISASKSPPAICIIYLFKPLITISKSSSTVEIIFALA